MTSTDFIAAWKNPAMRAHLSEQELAVLPANPAGRSPFDNDPAQAAGGMRPGPAQTIGMLTSFLSCTLACGETMWDGTCDFFTYGCC